MAEHPHTVRLMQIVSNPGDFVGASPPWQQEMRAAVRCGAELCRRLGLPPTLASPDADKLFPVFAPESFIARMRPGDPRDPLLLQVLPQAVETAAAPGYTTDPVGDQAAATARGLIHKYRGRALLVVTGVCAVHCRYCFRRHFPYRDQAAGDFQAALAQLRRDDSIRII